MTDAQHEPARRPPWWPDNETWPPPFHDRRAWRLRRRHFARRLGLLFGTVLVLSIIGGASLISFVVHRTGGRNALPFPTAAALVILVGLVAVLVFLRGMRRVGLPVSDVVTAARRIGDGDLAVRVRETGPPFLRSVAHGLNVMAARLQTQEAERRRLLEDVTHELRTPLSVMRGRIEGLLDGVYARDDAAMREVLDETRTLEQLVRDLAALANAESGALTLRREPVDLVTVGRDVTRSFATLAVERGVTLIEPPASQASDTPAADVDPIRIREVLANLLMNAIQHTPPGGTVAVQVAGDDESTMIRVRDTGSGISASDLAHVFDRFHKGADSIGSGLGLAIARRLVVAHGGHLAADSELGRGTTMTVTLPIADPKSRRI